MTEHIAIVVLMALVAYGAHIVQQEGMILEGLGKLWSRTRPSAFADGCLGINPKPYIPSFWQKPLWTCPPCMCSVWGIPVALILAPDLWPFLPIHLFAAAGLAAYLNR